MEHLHRPVLLDETVRTLLQTAEGLYVDGTVGCGGHSEAMAGHLGEKGRLICLDRDPAAVALAGQRLAPFGQRVQVLKASFAALDLVLDSMHQDKVDGVLLDLGISSQQIENSGRGFSFSRAEPLDMRMDPQGPVTAGDLIHNLPPLEMENILRRYGEERRAKAIVKAVCNVRRKERIESSLQLAQLIETVVPRSHRPGARHPATRSFQALRIAVNRELENLETFLGKAPDLIRSGGRIVVLTYHSLEDRMVKQAVFGWEKGCECPPDFPCCVCGRKPLFRRISKKGIKPTQEEIRENPRARSATLRAAERI